MIKKRLLTIDINPIKLSNKMDIKDALIQRRSIRKYKDEKVSRQTMNEIMELTRFAPSWANFQIARYTLIDDEALIERIAQEGVLGFAYNIGTLKNAKGVAVLSFVKGKSGKLGAAKGGNDDFATTKGNAWEVFDAGIACQTFCLAAHAHGVGTCIFGVIDDKVIAEIASLPEDETVGAIITYGYPEGEHPQPTPRMSVEEITRYL